MGLQVIICVETNKECKSDMIYIRNTIKHFYDVNQFDVLIKYVYIDVKGNYATPKVKKKIDGLTRQYNAGNPNGESVVVMCLDCDDYDTNREDAKFLKDAKEYCREKGYNFVWFCKDIEQVYLEKSIPKSQKKAEAEKFASSNKIEDVVIAGLKLGDDYQKGKSNLCTVMDKVFQKYITTFDSPDYNMVLDASAEWAKSVGMTENDISDAIRTVRDRKKRENGRHCSEP